MSKIKYFFNRYKKAILLLVIIYIAALGILFLLGGGLGQETPFIYQIF